MSLDDLKTILEKDPIISTFSPRDLDRRPDDVEQMYRTYARTHVPLGDTERHVETIARWTGGVNKGAFVGAVIGDYGQGKTSFLVHVWESCGKRGIFTIPPFTLQAVGGLESSAAILQNVLDGVHAWVQHGLGQAYPALAARETARYQDYRTKTIEDIAAAKAAELGKTIEEVLDLLKGLNVVGDITVDGFLDYLRDTSEIVQAAGYKGLLLLLDEPEIAAGKLGYQAIGALLFELIDKLGNLDGDFGVFFSIARRFYADFSARFASAAARLAVRGERIDLSRLYGTDFAGQLWRRYCDAFQIPDGGAEIVAPLTLDAIGQVGSSSQFGYGPRTVVSAFNRMVYRYQDEQGAYEPASFATDCMDSEILVEQTYGQRVQEVFGLPEVAALPEGFRLTLAAFPDGVSLQALSQLGITAEDAQRYRRDAHTAIYQIGGMIGFNALRKGGPIDQDVLGDRIRDVDSTFAPNPAAFTKARDVVMRRLMPRLFQPRQGQALTGWSIDSPWAPWRQTTTVAATVVGAFPQTSSRFPLRKLFVAVGDTDVETGTLASSQPTASGIDVIVHLRLNWRGTETATPERLVIQRRNPQLGEPDLVTLTVDLNDEPYPDEALARWVDNTRQTPLFLLVLLSEIGRLTLDKDVEAVWTALRDRIEQRLQMVIFAHPDLALLATQQLGASIGSGMELIPQITRTLLERRYPEYATLIRQPHWKEPVDNYLKLLSDSRIPPAARRGSIPWNPSDDVAGRVLGGNRMNLPAKYASLESLITIASPARDKPLEVGFRLHPLERQIRDRVLESGEKQKIEGKDCWWLPYTDELRDLIFRAGYQPEELDLILRIANARGSFSMSQVGSRRGLYCVPLDLPEMRRKLEESLAAARELATHLQEMGLPIPGVDLDRFPARIDAVEDDDEFHRLEREISNEHRLLEASLHARFEDLHQTAQRTAAEAQSLRNDARTVLSGPMMRQPPAGQSAWVTELSRVGQFITATLTDVESKAGQVTQAISEAQKLRDDPVARIDDRLTRLKTLTDRLTENRDIVDGLTRTVADARRHADLYRQWIDLLRASDTLHRDIGELETDAAHRAKATELRHRLDELWNEIRADLGGRLTVALDALGQYRTRLSAIETDRQQYVQGLTQQFNQLKERANLLLRRLEVGDAQIRQVFNRDQADASYRQMYEEGSQIVMAVALREQQALERARLELVYQRDILNRLTGEAATADIGQIDGTLDRLKTAAEAITLGSFRTAVETFRPGEDRNAPLPENWQAVRDAIHAAREALRGTRPDPVPPVELGDAAKEMLDHIGEGGTPIDLKSLIVAMLRDGTDSGDVLDTSLQALVELFRAGTIDIRVQRVRPR